MVLNYFDDSIILVKKSSWAPEYFGRYVNWWIGVYGELLRALCYGCHLLWTVLTWVYFLLFTSSHKLIFFIGFIDWRLVSYVFVFFFWRSRLFETLDGTKVISLLSPYDIVSDAISITCVGTAFTFVSWTVKSVLLESIQLSNANRFKPDI